ncbi:hypothetical protein [Brevibacillus sp. B_LB10_24]|uniref:hypothetical protein n=1 Tax=Brevibacillus sp. B_LB10_24 TaxID=3380645 RepID=UPI0038B72C74
MKRNEPRYCKRGSYPESETAFFIHQLPTDVTFVTDEEGKAVELVLEGLLIPALLLEEGEKRALRVG